MDSITNDNMQTNFLIVPRPTETDKITPEVNRQYIRLSIIAVFIFIIIVLSLKEFLDFIMHISDLSITDYLEKDEIVFDYL
jgi:hypothetical protein